MAFDLNPLALQNAAVLRALDEPSHGLGSVAALADKIGRDKDNLRKTLGVLAREGLLDDAKPVPGVTDDGRAQLAALGRAINPDAGGEALTALHADLEPHPLNPRKDFESDAAIERLNETRESILTRTSTGKHRGLIHPILVRPQPTPGKWWIIDGERRWRAVGQAIWDGDWDDDTPLPILIREVDDREHLMLSLTANIQRADMSAIEEGVAFAAAVHDFGLTTQDVADQTGKSQRYVQQRIALLKLSGEDQDRMRLPRDDPRRLSFKEARALTQTPRADSGAPSLEEALERDAEIDRETFAPQRSSDEPGSPPAPESQSAATAFGKSLSDRAALVFVEIADKSERHPIDDPALASEGYTVCQSIPVEGTLSDLVSKNAIGFRQSRAETLVRPRLFSTGAKAWLEEIGFYAHRADVLFEFRARVAGADEAAALAEVGNYLSHFLNPADVTPVQVAPKSPTPNPSPQQADEPHQPELIEPTEDEKRQRAETEAARAAKAFDDAAVDRFAAALKEKLDAGRAKGRSGWNDPAACSVEDLADALVAHLPKGDPIDVALFCLFLTYRAGAMGAPQQLRAAVARASDPEAS